MKHWIIAALTASSVASFAAPASAPAGRYLPDPRVEPIPGARPLISTRFVQLDETCGVEEMRVHAPISAATESQIVALIKVLRPGRPFTTMYERLPPDTPPELQLPTFRIWSCVSR